MHDCKQRCAWVSNDPIYINYHDHEWGVPIYDDRLLFEFLILEGAQAGLNWLAILKRREQYRLAFDHFDAEKIAKYDDKKYQAILTDSGVIRNRLKIQSAITNAQAYLKIKNEHNSFSDYLWQFVNGTQIKNQWGDHKQIPTTTEISDALSRDLKKRGFKFVGSTICYAYMQAVGMVNDHLTTCFRFEKIK
jgi:DNA-3-methyladenine glycosylase I